MLNYVMYHVLFKKKKIELVLKFLAIILNVASKPGEA